MTRRHYFQSFQSSQDLSSNHLTKYISTLEQQLNEKSLSPPNSSNFFFSDKPKYSKQEYLEELKKQVEIKAQREMMEKNYKKRPGISEDFHGYPNLPQTPREAKRRRELEQMRNFRRDLSEQLAIKQQSLNALRYRELEVAKSHNVMDYQLYLNERNSKLAKKENEKEALVSAWNQAKKAKELQQLLETAEWKSVKPSVEKSLGNVDFSVSRKMEDEGSQFNFEEDFKTQESIKITSPSPQTIDRKRLIKDRAKKLKEDLDDKEKNSYQFKIRELVKDAKKQRELMRPNFKTSASPIGNHHKKTISCKNVYRPTKAKN